MHRENRHTEFILRKELFFGIIGIVLTIVLVFFAIYYNDELKSMASGHDYGLVGMFAIAFIASSIFSMVPIAMPYWVITFTLPEILASRYGIWSPVWVALVTAVAASLAQFLTFMIGYGGRSLSEKLNRRFSPETYDTAVAWMKKAGPWAVFLMTLIPNPVNLPMTIAVALLKYPPISFLLYSFLGIGIRSFIIAFSGYYGMSILNQWIEQNKTEGLVNSPLFIIAIVIMGIVLVVGIWQLIIWMLEISDKNRKYKEAFESARKSGKPLLVVGGPWGVKPLRRLFNKPAHGSGDVCLDIDRRALMGHPCAVVASGTNIPFKDKTFGAVFSSHVMEHMPTVELAKHALQEMNRVADSVFIAYPSRQSIAAWIIRDHHIWIWQKGQKTYLRQRRDNVHRERLVVEAADKTGLP